MRITLETPADRLLTERAQPFSGWVEAPGDAFALTAACGGRPLALRPFVHPARHAGAAVQGFWGYLIVQNLLERVRHGRLTIDFSWNDRPLPSLDLRVSPLALELAQSHPLNLDEYPVDPTGTPFDGDEPPFTLIFPGLGGVGGASLNLLIRRKMFREGWSLPLYFEADDPSLWAHICAERPPAVRWIDGHDCYHAGGALGRPFARITLLREPIKRLLSVFDYNALVHPFEFPWRRLEDFVASGAARRYSQAVGLLRCAGVNDGADLSDAELGARARHELAERYALVGITELFEETLFLLCRLAGYRTIGMWWRVLAAPHSQDVTELSSRLRGEIERQLTVDLELYAEQRAALERILARTDLGPGFRRYQRDAAAQPELSDAHKAVECLRWRQALAESELARLKARPAA